MRLLVLAEDIRYNTTSGGICNTNFIDALLQNNFSIDLIVDFKEKDLLWLNHKNLSYDFVNQNTTSKLKNIFFNSRIINGIFTKINGFSIKDQLKINKWKKKVFYKLNNNQYSLIIFLGAGNSMLNYFTLLKLNTKIKTLVNLHDPYPDNNYPFPYKGCDNLSNIIKSKKIEKVLKIATFVSFPSLYLYEWMSKFYPIINQKKIIIPHINSKIDELSYLKNETNFNFSEDLFNLVHGGSLLSHRNPIFLINAFEKFLDKDANRRKKCFLHIIGRIGNSNLILNKKNITENIKIVKNRISYKQSKEIFSKSVALILLEAVSHESPFLPGKFIDYLDSKVNILALTPKKSEVRRLLGKNYPYICEVDDEDKILKVIEQLWNNWINTNNQYFVPSELLEYVSPKNLNEKILNLINYENNKGD